MEPGAIPVGHRRTYINLMLVMLIGGLWHGSQWTFIAWGAIHGAMLAFERFFGRAAPPEALALAALTPSDFTVVRKKAELLGLLDDTSALVDLLAAESSAKPGRPRPIGFATAQ